MRVSSGVGGYLVEGRFRALWPPGVHISEFFKIFKIFISLTSAFGTKVRVNGVVKAKLYGLKSKVVDFHLTSLDENGLKGVVKAKMDA